MKKLLAILLAAVMLLALTACGSTGQDGSDADADVPAATEAPAPQTVAQDTSAMYMSFTPPVGFTSADRYIEKASDGSVIDKSFTYYFDDDSEVIIGYTKGKQVTDEVPQSYLDDAEIIEYGGKSFSIVTSGSTIMGLCQDGDVVYGTGWSFADEIDRDAFDQLMNDISFTDNAETAENGDDLEAIRYTLDSSLNIVSVGNNLTETTDGEILKKSLTWSFGADADNIDFRLVIRVYKNSTVEENLPDDYRTEETEINGVTYTAMYLSDSEERPYQYFTQHGDDVYQIRNSGLSGSWTTTRSDESYEALEALMNTISFAA